MTDTNGYINYQDKVVIPECPEGEHSHWLPISTVDDDGKGSYTCDYPDSSGEDIDFTIVGR